MLALLAYAVDIAIVVGYAMMNKNPKWSVTYNWINFVANIVLTPYAVVHHAPADTALGVAFFVISIYGLVKHYVQRCQ